MTTTNKELDEHSLADELVIGGDVVVELPGENDSDVDAASGLYGVEADEEELWRAEAVGDSREPPMEVGESVEVRTILEEPARMAQRLLVSSLRRQYVRGRSYIDTVVQQVPITGQRRVALTSYFNVTDYKADELIDKLKQGRVVTRMGAAPGVGKTTRICSEIATRCGLRVCQVELNSHVALSASSRQRELYGIKGSNRRFPREPGAFLTCMTYDDFRSYVCSASRKRLFADFDVFFFDEAHTPVSSVWLALQYFAVYAQKHNSLIVASATVSTDEANNAASKRVGEYKKVDMDFRKAVDSGKLFTDYMRDRSMVLAPSDEDVWYAKAVYQDQGIDVQILDSASTLRDNDLVKEWLRPDSLTPRVVITTPSYGVGTNLPISFVVTAGKHRVYDWTEDACIVERILPLSERDVTQHMSRTGRGMTVGSGGLVLTTDRAADVELLHSERLRAYIGLVAGSIRPLPSQWEDVAALFPRGLTRDVALRIMAVPLPPMLVLRYLGSDGNVAAFFAQAMTIFSEPDHYIVPSKDVYPIGFDQWKTETYGGYFEGDESTCDVDVKVPFSGPPSLRVYMHALYAIATRRISVERWRPDLLDDDVSGSEDEAPRFKPTRRVVMPRLVVDIHKTPSPELPVVPSKWAFDVPEEQQARRRRRVAKDWASSPKGEQAIAELRRALDGTGIVGVVTADVKTNGETKMVEVRSPGGTVTVKLIDVLYHQLANGRLIDPEHFISLLNVIKNKHNRLVESGLFANWGPPWISVFSSCLDDGVINHVVDQGMVDLMVVFVKKLYDRFRSEVIEICKTSNVYRSWFERFMNKKPSLTRLVREVKSGRIAIAQSDMFIQRVLEIKELHDRAIVGFEHHGFYVPEQVTAAQRVLPLRDNRRRLSIVDDAVYEQPGSVVRQTHSRGYSR